MDIMGSRVVLNSRDSDYNIVVQNNIALQNMIQQQ